MQPVSNPPNPWESAERVYLEEPPEARIQIYEDQTRQILAHNKSPDLAFDWSVNPYRGCLHACAYCYARPTHEYLSFGAGTDFDTKIAVKVKAPELLRAAFEKRSWKGETVMFSGVTDCYQPIEASYRLTRGCLEVCAEYRNPVGIVTKAPLVERDIDILAELARTARVLVMVSVPFWDRENARRIEPHVAPPERRIETIRRLSEAGIPTGVMVAPVIPGLTDSEMVDVLTAAREAGATRAGYVLLRLPGSVKAVFEERVRAALPQRADKIMNRVRDTRDGDLYDTRWNKRHEGEGPYADLLRTLFENTVTRLGFDQGDGGDRSSEPPTFRRPDRPTPQLALF